MELYLYMNVGIDHCIRILINQKWENEQCENKIPIFTGILFSMAFLADQSENQD